MIEVGRRVITVFFGNEVEGKVACVAEEWGESVLVDFSPLSLMGMHNGGGRLEGKTGWWFSSKQLKVLDFQLELPFGGKDETR